MEFDDMERGKALYIIGLLLLISTAITLVSAVVDCTIVTQLISVCSTFITYGSPNPIQGSSCCDAMGGLNIVANSANNRQSLCRCLMGLITTYNSNATAIGTLPGFCGVYLGFTIAPNTDCNL
ncbi:Non-specific lipid-transfer protein [Quillaja saponaria]|uniref:Non-specific lipid-transfer protein n=1 Tax=Quillaja saponaria TaxID=32244 RepID=A0AAD7Q6D8_QUISA|nr:Non-specific lipid-transfer protein [Quillaja saponaria]